MALAGLINAFKTLTVVSRAANVCRNVALAPIGPVGQKPLLGPTSGILMDFVRYVGRDNPFKYKKGSRKCYRRIVEYPEKYTTNLLKMRKLGGRDPVTGRVVVATIGGGHKQKYRWVIYSRNLPQGAPPLVERVHSINYDPCRTANIAMVAHGDQKRWILASINMKAGDLIQTSSEIPRIPVRPKEGDAWPLGALPIGTVIHNVEGFPNAGGYFARAAGTCCQILRKSGGRVVIQIPSKRELSLNEKCVGVVGRVSNPDHGSTPIGSAQRNRWLGNRPRSGLWHRKDGYCGRKVRRLPPVLIINGPKFSTPPVYKLSAP